MKRVGDSLKIKGNMEWNMYSTAVEICKQA